MRVKKEKNCSRLKAAALQKIPCDLIVENVRYVNVFTGEIYPASVDILDGVVVRVREEGEENAQPAKEVYDGCGGYLIPGFIDTHVHVESSMMVPENLGRAVLPWGTTTICTDPHEIANVMGIDGIRFMMENSKKTPLRQYILAPSCIPSVPGLESTGSEFRAEEIARLLDTDDVIGIAEVMDFIGVCEDYERMHRIIEEGKKRNAYIQGHAPMVGGKMLAAYRLGGPEADHESVSAEEVNEKLRMGMHVNLRASSFINVLDILVQGMKNHRWHDFVSLCSDDIHAAQLLTTGSINHVMALAIDAGIEPVEAVRFATLNAAREYGFSDLGAVAPGYLADFQIVKELDGGMPEAVFVEGRLVARKGEYLPDDGKAALEGRYGTVQIDQVSGPEDFCMKVPGIKEGVVTAAVIEPLKENPVLNEVVWEEVPVKNGRIDIEGREDLTYVCVVNRYGNGGKTVSLLRKPGDKGAYGTTISHDSHNMILVYRNCEDAYRVSQILKEAGGGICVVKDGRMEALLELPVAGLMSVLPVKELSQKVEETEAAVRRIFGEETSLLFASVLALPCLPGVVITDYGLVDGRKQDLIPVYVQQ